MGSYREKMKKNCFFLPRLVLRCLGISVNSNESLVYKLYSFIMIFLGALYPWSNLHVLLHNQDNFEVVANAVFNFIGGLSVCAKIVVLLRNRKRLEKIFKEIERIQEKFNTEEWSQTEIYNTNKKMIIAMTFFYLSLVYFYVVTLTGRLTNDDHSKWRTPISEVSVINTTYSPNFEIAWAYQVLAVSIMSSGYCITDFLVAATIVDLTVQFKIFRRNIKQTFSNTQSVLMKNNEVAVNDKNWIYLNRILKKTVIQHLSLIDLVNETEKVYSHLIFHGVTGSLCVVCFALYYASVLPPLDPKALQSYLEIVVITCALFFTCYCGTDIVQASQSIATTCYETNFAGSDIRFQKSLMMIIMRSQKPVKFTVGGFVDLSIPVFVVILRSTYTYFMVLRKSNDSNMAG